MILKFSCRAHTHLFNGPFSGTTQVSRYQKGKINLDFTEARDSEWQWHQLDHVQVCTSLQTDNHASTPPLFSYRPDALPAAQPYRACCDILSVVVALIILHMHDMGSTTSVRVLQKVMTKLSSLLI